MLKITEAEWSVLEALWEHSGSLGDIVERLRPVNGWSRTTVHTYLTRMEAKGLVLIERGCEPHLYTAAITREECARSQREKLLNRVYRGSAGELIAAFLKETRITAEEKARLQKMLDEMEV